MCAWRYARAYACRMVIHVSGGTAPALIRSEPLMSARNARLMGRRAERRAAEARRLIVDAAWNAYLETAPGTDAALSAMAAVVRAERAA